MEPIPQELTQKELLERQYRDKKRDLRIGKVRAEVVKSQLIDAYKILETVRFDYVSDTAFREKVVGAKREIELALNDFLLSEAYWESNIERINKQTPQEYDESIVHSDCGLPSSLTATEAGLKV